MKDTVKAVIFIQNAINLNQDELKERLKQAVENNEINHFEIITGKKMKFTEEEKIMFDQLETLKKQLEKHKSGITKKEWLVKKYDILYDTLHEIQEYLIGEVEFR